MFSEKTCGAHSVINSSDDPLVACYDGNALVHIKTDGTVVARTDKATNGGAIVGPDDFASDGKGGVYATADCNRDCEPRYPLPCRDLPKVDTGDPQERAGYRGL